MHFWYVYVIHHPNRNIYGSEKGRNNNYPKTISMSDIVQAMLDAWIISTSVKSGDMLIWGPKILIRESLGTIPV
jgi:hypothetical protein